MKRAAWIPFVLLLGVLAWGRAAPAQAAPGKNLLENGGFEKGLDGWAPSHATATMKVEIDTKVRAEGKQSVHLTKPPASENMGDWLQTEVRKVPAGKKVAVTAKLKGKDLQNAWLKFFAFDAKGESLIEACDIGRYAGTFDWREVDREFDLPKETVRVELRLCMFMGGEAWLDDVKIVGDAAAAKDRNAPEPVTTGETKAKPLDAATKAWLDGNAVRIKTLDLDAPFEDLQPLKAVLEGARIVQLGENTHGDGRCFEAKARLARFLHEEMGFEVLAFESGLFECDRANELLRNGDAEGAMKASIFGIWHVAPVRALFGAMADRAKKEKPFLLAGFDCRRSGRLAGEFVDRVAAFLGAVAKPADADLDAMKALETLLREGGDAYKPPPDDLAKGMAAWGRVRKSIDDHRAALVAKHGESEVAFFARCMDNWRDDDVFERSKTDPALGDSSSLRDTHMGANLKWLAETRFPGKKIVTWGATAHLAHGLETIGGGAPRDYQTWTNMGKSVHAAFGKSCYTIGFAAHSGQAGLRGRSPFALPAPADGSVEDLLHRWGAPIAFVDFRRDGPFAKPLKMAVMGYSRDMEARWSDVLDGVVFIDEMTPAR